MRRNGGSENRPRTQGSARVAARPRVNARLRGREAPMSEKVRPGREQAHVVVAAVRVLAHLESRPPSVQEVAQLLGERPEPINVVLRELTELGILREVTDAYGARYEIGDYL